MFCAWCGLTSVVSDSWQPHGLLSARCLCPWDSPGINTGVGCRALFQGIFLTQGWNEPVSLTSPALAGGFFTTCATGEASLNALQRANSHCLRSVLQSWGKHWICEYGITVSRGKYRIWFLWASGHSMFINWSKIKPCFTLFVIARTWKQPRCPSADEWIRKLWYRYTMEYYSAIKKNSF